MVCYISDDEAMAGSKRTGCSYEKDRQGRCRQTEQRYHRGKQSCHLFFIQVSKLSSVQLIEQCVRGYVCLLFFLYLLFPLLLLCSPLSKLLLDPWQRRTPSSSILLIIQIVLYTPKNWPHTGLDLRETLHEWSGPLIVVHIVGI